VLQHAGSQPLPDETHDTPVRYTVLDEPHHPVVVDRREEVANVPIEHPVHPSLRDPETQGVQRVVRIAPSGLVPPSAFGIEVRRTGFARYAPPFSRSDRSLRFDSSCSPYDRHVVSSTPAAAFRFKR
jgi:hypothetical protein